VKTSLLLASLALCTCAHTADRFTLLDDAGTITWHGDVYGPQYNTYAVQWDAVDGDTVFVDSLESRTLPPPQQSGASAWYLQSWYMPDGQCSPFGCEHTYAWDCPAWSVAGLVVVDCRTLQP